MTTKSQPRNNADNRLAHNAKRASQAHERLTELLVEAVDKDFTGGVSIWIGSSDGRLGTFKTGSNKHHK